MEEISCYCSIVACIKNKNFETKQLFKGFLAEIKLPFDIVEYDQMNSIKRCDPFETQEGPDQNPHSHGLCLFLEQNSDLESTLKSRLAASPWKLDHVIESSVTKQPRKIAKQEFYSCSNDMPLISVSSVHYGNEHLRFHINVKNFYAMKKFYEGITDRKAKDCGPGFCFLTIHSENGLDVQIGLKRNPVVFPTRSNSFRLKFRIQSISPLFKYLATSSDSINETSYVLRDPDGNDVIVERSYSKSSSETVDENNNSKQLFFEKCANTTFRRNVWSRCNYLDHGGKFSKQVMSVLDGFTQTQEEDESESGALEENEYKDHITFV